MFEGYDELVARLDRAVGAGQSDEITTRIKGDLEDLLSHAALHLPERFRQARADCYARRLLHRDPGGRYTAVVMAWGPGQGTSVHDHGGLWCVEGVVEGEMTVTQYNVTPGDDGTFDVTPAGKPIVADVGSAGRLIPPVDYHVLANAQPHDTSITLHVYGGNLDGCRVFLPTSNGRYEQQFRALSYHD